MAKLDTAKQKLAGLGQTIRGLLPDMKDRKTWVLAGAVAAGVILLFLLVFGVLVYKYKSSSPVVAGVAKIVPYPAQKVNGRLVSYSEYLFELDSLKHYCNYAKNNNLPPEPVCSDDKKAREGILSQLKETAVVKQLLDKYKVKVSKQELDEQVAQLTESTGGEAKVRQALRDVYGWTLDDLRSKVEFQIARQKLQEKIGGDDSLNAQAKSKADEILAKVKAGEDFADLAKKNSQDEASAANGGDLDFFGKGKMVAEFENVAFALNKGQVSDKVVKTQFGYHIIKVTDKKGDTVRASHILIKSVDFEQYLQEEIQKAKVSVYVKA